MAESSPPKTTAPPALTNAEIAAELEEVAALLEAQGANPFRVRAYRNAAAFLRTLAESVVAIAETQGLDGLMQLPAIGRSLAHTLAHLAHSGQLPLLERLRGELVPERIFATVADIGPKLSHRIHEELGIETLSELAAAANDGRLARVPGFGAKRLQAVREALAGRFHHEATAVSDKSDASGRSDASDPSDAPPPIPIEEILDVDLEYRRLARQGRLPRIAPRRFNPTGDAWLPVLHTERDDRHYTALFSNTARAHELGTTHDWVVIYRDDDQHSGHWTVITSSFGSLRGRRVIRGYEADCRRHYEGTFASPPRRLVQKRLPF